MLRTPGDQLRNMECVCGYRRTFVVKFDAVACLECGRRYPITPPVVGVYDGECACGYNKTFVVDAATDYTCTNCGRRR